MRHRAGGVNEPFISLVGRLEVCGLKRNSELDTTMNEAGQPNQLIYFSIHEAHFNLNMIKLIPHLSMILLQLNMSLSYMEDG